VSLKRPTKKKLNKQKALGYLEKYTKKITAENTGSAAEYSDLQYTWNRDILDRSFDYIPGGSNKAIGIGSFQGALEIALSPFFNKVICVDFESFLPSWKPSNIVFHTANLDSGDWELPDREAMFDIAFCIETLEHLLWSPLPLLKWMRQNAHISVISTPDDNEWPPMPIRPWSRYQKYSSIPPASPKVFGNPEPMNHCKQYSQAEFVEMLDFAGFRLLEFFRTGEGKHQMVAIVQPR